MAGTLTFAQLKGYAMQAGFNAAQASIMAAIAMAESGGRPTAYNGRAPDNSYGLWQINMIGAMGPERRQQFGISSNSQLFDPLTNARAAYAVFRQQGFRAWSVYQNNTYQRFLSGANAATVSYDTGNYSPGGAVPALLPQLNWQDVAAQFGMAAAFFNQDPSLRALVEQAAKEGWDQTRFQGALMNTAWYKRLSASQRQWQTLITSDPAEARQRAGDRARDIMALAKSMGVDLGAGRGIAMADTSLRYGWDQAQLRRAIAGSWVYDPSKGRGVRGEGGAAATAVMALYRAYGLGYSQNTIHTLVRNMLVGADTPDSIKARAQAQATKIYPHLASALSAGQSINQIMSPYAELAAREVNANPNTITWTNPKWATAIGTAATGVMPIDQWQTLLRTSPTYGYDTTPQARQQAAQFATAIAEQFGGIG